MIAYDFIAHDRAGLTFTGITADGMCKWKGTKEQFVDAKMQKLFFEVMGYFYQKMN